MTHPGLFESDPFLLPGHFLVGAVRDVPEHCEIVGKAFGKTIIRSPKLSFALETACPPSVPDVIKTINADHVEIDKITDPQKLHIVAERALANLAMLARAGNGKALWHFASLTSAVARVYLK